MNDFRGISSCRSNRKYCEDSALDIYCLYSSYTYSSRHIQLLENNKCSLVVGDCRLGNLFIFCEEVFAMDTAIKNQRHKKLLHRDKIGHEFLLAFDEARRMLALCATRKVRTVDIFCCLLIR